MGLSFHQNQWFPMQVQHIKSSRVTKMRMKYGAESFMIYMLLLAELRMMENFRIELDYDVIEYHVNVHNPDLLRIVIEESCLFDISQDDDGTIWVSSKYLNQEMAVLAAQQARRSEIARMGALARHRKAKAMRQATTGRKPGLAHPLPTDGGNVSVPSSDNVSSAKKTDNPRTMTQSEVLAYLKSDEGWLTAMSRKHRLPRHLMPEILGYFVSKSKISDSYYTVRTVSDSKKYFENFVRQYRVNIDEYLEKYTRTRESQAKREAELKEKSAKEKEEEQKDALRRKNRYRNLGYEPFCTEPQNFINPDWRAQNPPQHPEWIGLFNENTRFKDVKDIIRLRLKAAGQTI